VNNAPNTAFDLDVITAALGNAASAVLHLVLRAPSAPVDSETGRQFMTAITDAIAAGHQACTEVTRLRAAFGAQRDAHRPQPHANSATPGALCAACSLHGALVSWPCEPWTAAERVLTHGRA
jgi:hypothetical protein